MSTSPNGTVNILTTILDPLTVLTRTIDTVQEIIPGADDDLKAKFRWINCSLKNITQFNYTVVDNYLSSGRYWKPPAGDKGFSSATFSCCNGEGAISGATGGTAFSLWLDSQQSFDFAVGWSDPLVGSLKAGVVESATAEAGYEAVTREGGHIQSKNLFAGKDENGKPAKFYIQVSASPGKDPMSFVVQQVPYTEDEGETMA
ncbi:hypothetical protein BDR04DRAFT_1107731 [Suillus decipiens]|nr:hypothetical protein BDR04DRAFT_1107731 [Suillus decipiens]